MSDQIKPCPFCGAQPETFGSGERQRGLMIQCIGEDCPNPSVSYYDHATAIRVWNRRAAEPPKVAPNPEYADFGRGLEKIGQLPDGCS